MTKSKTIIIIIFLIVLVSIILISAFLIIRKEKKKHILPLTPANKPGVINWLNNSTIPNKCMSVSSGVQNSGKNGTEIALWDCANNTSTDPNLQFQKIGNQIVWTNNDTIPNKCVSVANGIQSGGKNNTGITLWDCPANGTTDPNMEFKINGNQLVWLNNGSIPGKCIGVSNGMQNKGANGTEFILWDCANNTSTDPNLQFSLG